MKYEEAVIAMEDGSEVMVSEGPYAGSTGTIGKMFPLFGRDWAQVMTGGRPVTADISDLERQF